MSDTTDQPETGDQAEVTDQPRIGDSLPSVQDLALQMRGWLLGIGAMDSDLAGPGGVDASVAPPVAALAATAGVFLSKQANQIFYSEDPREITVYTRNKLTLKNQRDIAAAVAGMDLTMRFEKLATPTIGHSHQPPHLVEPETLFQGRYTCGSSISVANVIDAGTFGCLVRDAQGALYGLTNNHVTGQCNFTDKGMPILAPATFDARAGGTPPFTLGTHHDVLPFVPGVPDNVNVADNSDAAIFRISDESRVSSMQRAAYDTPAQVITPAPGMIVQKVGRTTGLTQGVVVGKEVGTVAVNTKQGHVHFQNVYSVHSESADSLFCSGGDSGSLVTVENSDGNRFATGIVMAACDTVGYILPIHDILTRLGVTLVSGHNAAS